MTPYWRPAAGAAVLTALLAACSPSPTPTPTEPTPSPEDAFIADVIEEEGIVGSIPRDGQATLIETAEWACEELEADDLLTDGTVAAFGQFQDEGSGYLWELAVTHFCPEREEALEIVKTWREAAGL